MAADELTAAGPAAGRGGRAASIAWAVAVTILAAGMLFHAGTPWEVRGPRLIGNVVVPVLALVYLLAYFWGWGAILARLLRLPRAMPWLAVLPLGICGASTWLFVIGMAGGFRPWALVASSVVVIPAGWAMRRPPLPGRVHLARWPPAEVLLLLLACIVALQATLGNLMPLPSTAWDSIAYHLPMGQIYLRHGRIVAIPWMGQANFPLATDLLFFHGIVLHADAVVPLINACLYLLSAVVVFRMARLYVRRIHAMIVMIAALTYPEGRVWLRACYVEIGWMLFATLALWCLLEWERRRDERGWIDLAAIFTGFAIGTKLPAVLGAATSTALVLAWSFDRKRPRAALFTVGRFVLIAGLVGCPTYVKSWLHSGTPVWPLSLGGVFHLRDWTPAMLGRVLSVFDQLAGRLPLTPDGILLTPWRERSDLTAVLLPCLLIAVAARPALWRRTAPLVLTALTGYSVLFLVTHQYRFVLFAVPAMLVGLMAATAPSTGRTLPRLAFGAFWLAVLALEAPAWLFDYQAIQLYPFLSGYVSRAEVMAGDALYRASKMVEAHTTKRDRILLFGEVRGYHIDREWAWGDPLAQPLIDYWTLRTPAAVGAELHRQGYTHVLFKQPSGVVFYPDRPVLLMETFLLAAPIVGTADGFQLYDVRQLRSCAWTGLAARMLGGITAASASDADRLAAEYPGMGSNLLPNGDFEHGFDDWTMEWPGMHLVRGGLHGSTALHITGPAGASGINFAQLRANVPVEPGQRYVAGAWLRTRDLPQVEGEGAGIEVVAYDATSMQSWRSPRAIHGTTGWTLVVLPFQVPDTTRQVLLFAPRVPRFVAGQVEMDGAFLTKLDTCAGSAR